jgi:hypothetical protein
MQQRSRYIEWDDKESFTNILNPSWMQVFNSIADVIVDIHSIAVCSSMNIVAELHA